ncbi:MAG: MATE family efflux transporter [Bacteroidota bacterium]
MKDLTVGKESKLIFMFALPMLLGNVFQQLYNIVDSVIVGNFLGKNALAAVGASFPVIFVLISLVIGLSMGSSVVISQYFGAKQYPQVKKAVDTLFVFLFFSSIVLTVVGLLTSRWIFTVMKLPQEIMEDAVLYYNIFLSGLIMMFGYNGTASVLRGMGDSKTPLYFLIISTILNIILVIVFIEFFKWGIAGAALATVIAQTVAFILAIIYLNRYHELIHFSFKNIEFDRDIFLKSLKIGIPSGLQQTFLALGMMALMRIVNDFGTDAIAAYAVAGRIDSFAALPAMNFSMALSAFVGQNLGANKPERVKAGYKATLLMTTTFSLIVTAITILFSDKLMMLFNHDPNVVKIGVSYLIIVSSFYVVFTAMFINNGVMRGAGDTLIPMFITLFALWVLRIPISWYLSRTMGTDGIWWGIPIAWVFGLLASYTYYKTGRWKKKVIVKPLPAKSSEE